MRVLVACEFSGRVRESFIKRGHDAWSCDLIHSEITGNHIVGDVRDHLTEGWDLMIAHPPCTYLARSGARWWKEKQSEQAQALEFVQMLFMAPVPRIAIENPIGIINTKIRKPDQILQPWQFGYSVTKSTCLWLKNLPLLIPTKIVSGWHTPQVHWANDTLIESRWKLRSRTYKGIARAMATQWGNDGK